MRRVVLVVLLAWALGSLYVFTSFLWTPQGALGLTADYGGVVTDVVPDSPAARAGVMRADRIDLARTPFESRPKLVGVVTPVAAGTVVPFVEWHGAVQHNLTLTAVPATEDAAGRISRLLQTIGAAIFILVGGALIWLRPGPATWGFGLFGLLINPVVPALSHFPSARAHLVYVILYDVLQNIGVVGLLVFTLNFPSPPVMRWQRAVARTLPAVFVVLAAWTSWIDVAICVVGVSSRTANAALQVAFGIVDVVAIALITYTYLTGPRENRPRLRWVLVGFYVGLLCNYIGTLLVYTANAAVPQWLDAVLIASEVTLPLAVAYAVIRHRVIEIDLFLSRALVYAFFTTILVMLFGATDWIFSRLLENFRVSLVFDAAISIAVAFVFDSAHKMLEHAVSRVVFRARQLAYDRLRRASNTLRFAHEETTVDRALIDEPRDAFGIAAMALFRRDGDAYRLANAAGFDRSWQPVLGHDDRLPLEHEAKDGPLYLAEVPWRRDDLPPRPGRPLVSLPLRGGQGLLGMLLCSAKRNGEDLDPQELRRLTEYANAAAVAYERLDADAMRRKVRDLERDLSLLNARLDEAHLHRERLT